MEIPMVQMFKPNEMDKPKWAEFSLVGLGEILSTTFSDHFVWCEVSTAKL